MDSVARVYLNSHCLATSVGYVPQGPNVALMQVRVVDATRRVQALILVRRLMTRAGRNDKMDINFVSLVDDNEVVSCARMVHCLGGNDSHTMAQLPREALVVYCGSQGLNFLGLAYLVGADRLV